jgi:phage baseplate assembly protein W
MPTSLTFPFTVIGGRIATTTDLTRQVEQKIISVLTTDRLERVGIPDYGAGVNQLLFEPIDALVSADYRVDAMNELVDRISGIVVVDIVLTTVSDTEADVTVFYKLPLAAVRQTTFRIALPGTLSEESGF